MAREEELEHLRQENTALRTAGHRKDDELEQLRQANEDLREGLKQALMAISTQQERVKALEGLIDSLQERIKTLERQRAKDSHNSSLPPSSDRFVRAPKSLRQKSGKKPGGQPGHRGHHLQQVANPDQILLHAVERCEHCQHDLRAQKGSVPERRQVLDLPVMNTYSFHVRYWCPDCGEQFRGYLHIQTIEESGQIGQRRDACPSCGSIRVSPHVRTKAVLYNASTFDTPSLQHDIEAMKRAVDEGDSPGDLAKIVSFLERHPITAVQLETLPKEEPFRNYI